MIISLQDTQLRGLEQIFIKNIDPQSVNANAPYTEQLLRTPGKLLSGQIVYDKPLQQISVTDIMVFSAQFRFNQAIQLYGKQFPQCREKRFYFNWITLETKGT